MKDIKVTISLLQLVGVVFASAGFMSVVVAISINIGSFGSKYVTIEDYKTNIEEIKKDITEIKIDIAEINTKMGTKKTCLVKFLLWGEMYNCKNCQANKKGLCPPATINGNSLCEQVRAKSRKTPSIYGIEKVVIKKNVN